MAFCTSCGKELPADAVFCEHCGAKQEIPPPPPPPPPVSPFVIPEAPSAPSAPPEAPVVQAPTVQAPTYSVASVDYGSPAAEPPVPRKPMSRGVKIALISAGVIVVGLFAFTTVMKSVFTPEKTVNRFLDAIRAEDYAAFASVTVPATDNVVISEETVGPFFAAFSTDDYELSNFQDSLQEDVATLRTGMPAKGNGVLRLVQQDYFLFQTYSVELRGATVQFQSPLPGASVTMGGQTLTIPEADTMASLSHVLPGAYEMEATVVSSLDGSKFVDKQTVVVGNYTSGYVSLDFDYCALEIYVDEYPLSGLLINDKPYSDVPTTVDAVLTLAPLRVGDVVEATFSIGGVEMSDRYEMTGAYDEFVPRPKLPDEVRAEGLELARTFLVDYFVAVNAQDLPKLQELNKVENSFIDNDIETLQEPRDGYFNLYTYTITDLQGDLSFSSYSDSDYALYCSTYLYCAWDYTYESFDGSVDSTTPYSTGDSSDSSIFQFYLGRTPEGQWVIDKVEYSYYGGLGYLEDPVALSHE